MCYNASGSGGRKKYKTPFRASHYFRVTYANLRDIYKAEFTIFPLKFTPPFTCSQLMALLFLLSVKTGTSPHSCYYYLLDSSLSNLTKSLSVQFSCSVTSDSLQPHESKHAAAAAAAKLPQLCPTRLCATPWTAAHQASPSLGFSRQEHWGGLPFPSPMHESEK